MNTSKFGKYKKEVDKVLDAAELLGEDVITVIGRKPGAYPACVSTIEMPKTITGANGFGTQATTTIDNMYLYPDKGGTRFGFMIDTAHNRNVLIGHLQGSVLKPINKKVIAELEEQAGRPLTRTAPMKPTMEKSKTEVILANKASQLEDDLAFKVREMELQKQEIEELRARALAAEQRNLSNQTAIVTELDVDVDGEVIEVETELKSPVEAPASKTAKTKAAMKKKPLGAKKIKKK